MLCTFTLVDVDIQGDAHLEEDARVQYMDSYRGYILLRVSEANVVI
jgi:hypothetical protein